jgi:hypothetical protein
MTTIIHKDLSYAVKGACFDVHNALGPMLPERFYQAALTIVPQRRGDRREISRILRLDGEKKENLCTSTN